MHSSSRFRSIVAAALAMAAHAFQEVRAVATVVAVTVGSYILDALKLSSDPSTISLQAMPHANPGLTQRQRHDLTHQPLERTHRLPSWSMCPST